MKPCKDALNQPPRGKFIEPLWLGGKYVGELKIITSMLKSLNDASSGYNFNGIERLREKQSQALTNKAHAFSIRVFKVMPARDRQVFVDEFKNNGFIRELLARAGYFETILNALSVNLKNAMKNPNL